MIDQLFPLSAAMKHGRYTLEGLYLSAGLGTPRDSPGRAGGSGWGEGCLGCSAETVRYVIVIFLI